MRRRYDVALNGRPWVGDFSSAEVAQERADWLNEHSPHSKEGRRFYVRTLNN